MFFPSLRMIATTDVIKVDIHASIQDALKKMHEYNHRSVVVVNGVLHHLITSKDIIGLRLQGVDLSTPLSQVELRILPVLDKESNVITALNLTRDMDQHICVCNENGTLYGLVTNSDIVASVDPQVILDTLEIGTVFDRKFGFRSLSVEATMDAVLALMKDAPTDCVIIHRDSIPAGIVTSKDILKFIDDEVCHTVKVESVMSSPIETLPASTSISEALQFIKERHYKRIVVVNDGGEILGIVTQQDLISRTYLKWSQLVNEHFEQFQELTELLQQKNRHLASLAMHDPLTGISNRHMFAELYEKELAMLKRYNGKLSLVMIDLDHFKHVNDTYGHNIGDSVLKEFTQIVLQMIREADFFARWGGEEFVLLLPETMCDQAFIVCEKIRLQVEKYTFREVGQVTCSIGMTEIDATDTLESGIERADRALYEAKRLGRNQTMKCESGLDHPKESG
ncbi:MAG: diguanylate cyclase [Sulfuricurvum sp.]|nr:diguanylate cyclase [Sulfuricurvum sp.]